jgi:death on curing protein
VIPLEEILSLHKRSIEVYGGSHGLRDIEMLESAIARPFQTFGGEDLYPTIIEKAAALGESIIKNHPFIDGNKRTGFLAIVALIESSGYAFVAKEDEAYRFIIQISTGDFSYEDIVQWLQTHVVEK